MKNLLILAILWMSLGVAYADSICIDKSFLRTVPSKSVQVNIYLNQHFPELIYLIEKNDPAAYKTGFDVLSSLIRKNAIPDNEDGLWKLDKLASFLAFYEDRFELSLSKLPKAEVLEVFKFYDLKFFKHAQPNDFDEIKKRLS
jgi:hypothetical protein